MPRRLNRRVRPQPFWQEAPFCVAPFCTAPLPESHPHDLPEDMPRRLNRRTRPPFWQLLFWQLLFWQLLFWQLDRPPFWTAPFCVAPFCVAPFWTELNSSNAFALEMLARIIPATNAAELNARFIGGLLIWERGLKEGALPNRWPRSN